MTDEDEHIRQLAYTAPRDTWVDKILMAASLCFAIWALIMVTPG